jgi:alkanesulfonate monooxygenase SsuD/methylene tetrahydromethanopterin reductase-like flavin-dependent oxidoreductase (luciferase family)
VKFGLSLTCARAHGETKPAALVYAEALETARMADELGFDTVVVSEHHFLDSSWCPAPLVLATAIAAQTSRVRVGSGILILPLCEPVRLAEEIAVLDTISGGRAIVGLGLGYRREEFAGYGVAFEDRASRWRELLDVLPTLLSGATSSHAGEHFRFTDVAIRPAPLQRPHPPIWIGTGHERGIRSAARAGFGIYLGNAAPKALLARRIRWFLDELGRAGGATEPVVPLMRELHVAPTRAQALAEAGAAIEHAYKRDLLGLGWGIPLLQEDGSEGTTDDPDHPALALERLIEERCIVGSPEDCAARIREYERIGATHLLFRVHHAQLAMQTVLRSLSLFAEQVMPEFA